MDENLHNIEDLFKEALEDDEEMPPPKVWKGIEHKLDKDNVISITRKYENLKRVAFLLLLLLAGLAIYRLDKSITGNEVANGNKRSLDKRTLPEGNPINTPLNKNDVVFEDAIDVNEVDTNNLNIKDNSALGYDVLSNQIKRQLTNTSKRKSKKYINDNKKTSDRDIAAIKIQQELKHKSHYDNMKKRVLSDDEQTLTDNLERQGNHQPQFNSLPDVGVKETATNFIDTNKVSESLSKNKLIPIADTNIISLKRTKTKDMKLPRFSVGAFFSPDIASYDLEDDNTNNQHDNAVETKKSERHEFSSTSGVFVHYSLNRNWSFQSGLTYSNINISVEPKTIYAQNDNLGNIKYRLNTSSGYAYLLPSFSSNPNIGDSLYTATSTHTLRYVGIPVAVKYSIEKARLIFNVKAGVSMNFLTKGRIETEVEKGANNETEVIDNLHGLKKLYSSGLASAGVDYLLNKRIAITFEPTWRFALNAINKDAPVKSYPRSFGLAVGVRMGL